MLVVCVKRSVGEKIDGLALFFQAQQLWTKGVDSSKMGYLKRL